MSAVAFNAATGAEIWHQWLGHQVCSSALYVDDPSGAKVYQGCDSYSITCFNATSGMPLSLYVTDCQVYSSPAIYDSKIYVGSADTKVYCFDDTPVEPTSIFAESNKGAEMWSNETIVIKGQLSGTTIGKVWSDLTTEVDVDSPVQPGLPNATVLLSFTKPDMTSVNLTTTTDNQGFFTVSYNPDGVGSWGWVAYYNGEEKPWITYASAYGEWNPVSVTSPTASGENPPPPEGGLPMEYVYVAVAVIVIVLVAIGVYMFLKRK